MVQYITYNHTALRLRGQVDYHNSLNYDGRWLEFCYACLVLSYSEPAWIIA